MSRSRIKKIILKALMGIVITILVLVVAEGLCWMSGVKPVLLTRDPLVGFKNSPSLYEKSEGDIYATRPVKVQWFNHQAFPVKKGDNTCRIFCLGGSTTYGRPYEDKVSFSGYLRRLLTRAEKDTEKKWEVINAGGISYASYRVARLMQELVDYQPDLFIVYCGHNEFLEERTYGEIKDPNAGGWLRAAMMKLRLYAVMGRLAGKGDQDTKPTELGAEVQATLDDIVGPSAYERDEVLAANIVEHYRLSIDRMISLARNAGAEIVFVMPASNLKDMSPFKSESGTGQKPGDPDARHALTQYESGSRLFKARDYAGAKVAFVRAVDEDVCALRMVSSLKDTLRRVCAERDVRLVDYAALLEADSERRYGHNILGREYFHDHVHPNLEATYLLAVELLEVMCRMHLVERSAAFDWDDISEIRAEASASLTGEEKARALVNLAKVLTWAGKFGEATPVIQQAINELPDDGEAWFLLGLSRMRDGRKKEAMDCYAKAVQLDPDNARAWNNLGQMLLERGKFGEAESHFRKSIRLEPGQVQAHYNLGNLLAGRKDFAAAEAEYRRALAAAPEHVLVLGNLGNVLGGQGRWKEAIVVYERVLELEPEDSVATRNLAVARKMAER